MCILCFCLAALSGLGVLASGTGAFPEQKMAELRALILPHLPADARGDQARRALDDLLANTRPGSGLDPSLPSPRRWTFKRTSEARLLGLADTAATAIVTHAREALRADASPEHRTRAGADLLATLTKFYVALGSYPGAPGGTVRRLAPLAGAFALPLALAGAGLYVAEFPELCGAAPDLFGGHGAHVLLAGGAAGTVGLGAVLVSSTWREWLNDTLTRDPVRAAGAARIEAQFWRAVREAWLRDPELSAVVRAADEAFAPALLRLLDARGGGVREACEALLAPPPACPKCA